jgi:hypothetical protein
MQAEMRDVLSVGYPALELLSCLVSQRGVTLAGIRRCIHDVRSFGWVMVECIFDFVEFYAVLADNVSR